MKKEEFQYITHLSLLEAEMYAIYRLTRAHFVVMT